MSLPATDGLVLRGTLTYPATKLGGRYPLAVLAHQYPATRDSWAPLATDLQSLGIATLAFDQRGHGESIWAPHGLTVIDTPAGPAFQDVIDAFVSSIGKVGFAHIGDDVVRVASWGGAQNYIDATRLLLFGASVGGPGVLLAAHRFGDATKGVVTLGAAGAPAHGDQAMARVRAACESSTAPILLTSSEGDAFDGATNVRVWSEGLEHVRAHLVAGDAHAMAVYYDVRDVVLDFVERVTR